MPDINCHGGERASTVARFLRPAMSRPNLQVRINTRVHSLLIDNGRPVFESSTIIEYLQVHHPGPTHWIPDGDAGVRVRFLDRFFDLYVMGNMAIDFFTGLNDVVEARTVVPSATPQP